ncbi:MAG: hypothetical protein KGL39_00865 [Patescibacteria group bacterium]|nr:hypothetical protein [Patescibacteria group bacterium]
MIRECLCARCKKPLRQQSGEFHYTVQATAHERCRECFHDHPDKRNRIWIFCSADCLIAGIQPCPSCEGDGWYSVPGGELGTQKRAECEHCHSVGIEVLSKKE